MTCLSLPCAKPSGQWLRQNTNNTRLSTWSLNQEEEKMNLPDTTNGGPTIESVIDSGPSQRELTSKRLTPGEIYSRASLRSLFDISDATINNGVFPLKGSASIWLFVTEKKTGDRTPYRDLLEGDTLRWQGQMAGRTDGRIINHQAPGPGTPRLLQEKQERTPGIRFPIRGTLRVYQPLRRASNQFRFTARWQCYGCRFLRSRRR